MLSRRALLALLLSSACARMSSPAERHAESYGSTPRQRGEWWVAPGRTEPGPLVVLVHGGYWRDSYDLTLEDRLAADLCARGFLVWNVDYAPSTAPWPATLTDAASAYDFAFRGRYASLVDRDRVAVVGHSAGGHLALWLASRTKLADGAPGGHPSVVPALAVPQAPVASLRTASRLGLGSGAVDALLGGTPDSVPSRYDLADPVALAPSGVRTVIVHGVDDDVVPIRQSEEYVAASPQTVLRRVAGGHFEHLDPASEACDALRSALAEL